ncbi:MAG: hypothetical protein EAY69_08500 [Cytophagales bacterium]|nr:MAG: hypothetical protein EAY69_08500 [Cytophagales bacterium]
MKLQKRFLFFLIFIFFSFNLITFDKITSALKYIKKGEYQKAKNQLNKIIEKDSLHAGALHILSVYYFTEKNPAYHLDSAYLCIQKAIKNYSKINPKDLKEWQEEEITLENAKSIKINIEGIAFENAKKANQIDIYQLYLKKYPEAKQKNEVEMLRNELIWQNVLKNNSLQEYQIFLNQYPKAIQIPKAIQKIDSLQIVTFAAKKTVLNLEIFIKNYPNNQYKNLVIKDLFQLKSLGHTSEIYQKFLNDYPDDDDNSLAKRWILSLAYQQKKLNSLIKTNRFPIDEYWKKLNNRIGLQFIPFLEDEKYNFIDENGEITINTSIDEIPKKYHCETIKTPYLLYYKNGSFGIGDIFGNIWYPTQFDKVENINDILIKVSKNTSVGVINALTGQEILPIQYDMVEILTPQLFKVRKNRRWGLVGMNGQIILEPTFSEIESLCNDFIVAYTDGQTMVWTWADILAFYQEKTPLNLSKYEKIECINPNFIKIKNEKGFNIMDKKGSFLFNYFQEKIEFWQDACFATFHKGKYQIYNEEGQKISTILFDKVLALPQRIAVKNEKKWGILTSNGRPHKDFTLDSVAVAGNLMIYWEGKKIWVEGKNQKIIDLTGAKNLRFEKPLPNFEEWFLVYNEATNNKKNILSSTGQKLLSNGNFQSYFFITPQFLTVQQAGKYGLVDSLGRIIIMPRYDGILPTNDHQRKILSLAGKFGIIDKNSMIEPVFDQIPIHYSINNEMIGYFGRRNNLFGLVNGKGKNLVPFEFQNLIVWSDSVALVQNKKEEWLFYHFYKTKDKTSKSELTQIKIINQNNNNADEQSKGNYIIAKKYNNFGIWHGKKGMIVPPDFDQIINIGTTEKPFFFAEKKSEDKKRYQVRYYNHNGKEIWSKVMNEEDYLRLVCE